MLTFRTDCPCCGSKHIIKNGKIHNKKSKYKCQDCGREFVEKPNNKIIGKPRLAYIDKMLLVIYLAGIALID